MQRSSYNSRHNCLGPVVWAGSVMASSQLSPPGSSQYKSNTIFVGDGTWDSERNTFLLPNLVGLNFDTMRYNGTLHSDVLVPEETDIFVQEWGIAFEICLNTTFSFEVTA